MTLRLRLSVILTGVLLVIIAAGTTYLMFNARHTIGTELESSVDLSAQLIVLALEHVAAEDLPTTAADLERQFSSLGERRNLHILQRTAPGTYPQPPVTIPASVPRWFVRLVHPQPMRLQRLVEPGAGVPAIVLRADATDEIAESWREIKPVLFMSVLFGVAAIVLVYAVIGRALGPLRDVSQALQAIEAGDFDSRVAPVGVPEVDGIAAQFNQMSATLERSHQETQMLTQRSLMIEEAERRRLAHELHDELGQSISAIKALAVSIRDRTPPAEEPVVTSANTIVEVSSDIYARVRRMMAHLRPVVLDEFGLVSALQNMIDDWNAHHEDTFCQFEVEGTVPHLDGDVAISCYRIVQEALTNIAKHAAAEQAAVVLRYTPGGGTAGAHLYLQIDDDGCGFDPDNTKRGLGLVGIRERVDGAGGELGLKSSHGKGTRYDIVIPLGSATS